MNDLIDRLGDIAHDHGYDFDAKVDIASETAWGAEVRLSRQPHLGRAIVFAVGGSDTAVEALERAVDDALAWLATGTTL